MHSLQSWLLLLLGLALAGIAVAKGYSLDDPYPAYGAVDRRRIVARREYEAVRHNIVDGAEQIRDDFTEKLRVKIETLRASSTQRQQILAARARSLAEFKAHEINLADAARQLLSVYRRANEAARSAPAPAHFRTRFTFSDEGAERPAIQALLGEQGLEIDADGLLRELDTLRQHVLTACQALIEPTKE